MKDKEFAKKTSPPDYILLSITGVIILFGLFVLASVTSVGTEVQLVEQILLGFLPGGFLAYFFFKVPLSVLYKWAPYLLLGSLILTAMVFIPFFSETVRGGTRWLSLGEWISFQPTELLKLTFVFYVSSWLVSKNKKNLSFKETLLPFAVVCGVITLLLVMQRDLSTLAIILFTGFIIYFAAKTPLWHSVAIVSGGGVGLLLLIFFTQYRLERVIGFLNPDMDPLGATYQIKQALITVGSGGLFGLGLGMSQQKFGFLPFPETDSIFAIIAEETGFIGSMLLILLFLGFFLRGFWIAKEGRHDFAKLISLGICVWIFIQTSVSIGAMIGVFPVTGIPLPFISYGKSHLITEMIALGVLLNASQYKKPKNDKRNI